MPVQPLKNLPKGLLGQKKIILEKYTVMIVDIVGYTGLTHRMNEEEFNELHEKFDAIVLGNAKKINGKVIKKVGDAFIIIFKEATNAMKCGIAIQDDLKEYNVEEAPAHPFDVRVVLHTGEIMLRKGDIYGSTINTASRMEKLAHRGEIVFSGATFLELDKGKYPFYDLGQHHFRGVEVPITVFRLKTRDELEQEKQTKKEIKPKKLSYSKLITEHFRIIRRLRYESGIFASAKRRNKISLGRSWLRDNFYTCLAFTVMNDWKTIEKTYQEILKLFLKHEDIIKKTMKKKQKLKKREFLTIHFDLKRFKDFWEEWGHKQHDTIGSILFMVAKLEEHKPKSVLKSYHYVNLIKTLIKYLESVEYWHSKDKGFWSDNEDIHASSIGACVAGLKEINKLPNIDVPEELIKRGEKTLRRLLPRESKKKFVDLALLSLIYPYNIVTEKEKKEILKNTQYLLIRDRGVIRYKNDHYYNKNEDKESEEAEWLVGFAWLAVILEKDGKRGLAEQLVKKVIKNLTPEGIPEVYLSNSKLHSDLHPGWVEGLFLLSLYDLHKLEQKRKDPLSLLIQKQKNKKMTSL